MNKKEKIDNFIYNYLINAIIGFCVIFIIYCCYITIRDKYNSYIFNKYLNTVKAQTNLIKHDLKNINWDECDMQNKMDIIHRIVDNETYYLQLDSIPIRRERVLEDNYCSNKFSCAYYSPYQHVIVYNNDYLLNASLEDIINTTCHEMYHAFEYSLVMDYQNMNGSDKIKYYNSKINEYSLEFENYTSGKLSYDKYFNQAIESDSRKYATKRIIDYLE